MLADIGSPASNLLQHKTGSAVRLTRLHVDTAKMTLKDRPKEPFLFNIFAEQKTPKLLQHSNPLPSRQARKASGEIHHLSHTAWRLQVPKDDRTTRESPEPDNP